ncbi:hypothetical protein P872_01985 [Rhodonellum psychrophilum GCM71 = DSM 17998]|uniref:Uncharacterized protein n=1 Tax=Rhodonellum psychrophilum GCM71 = DSM 17998 TaxID=1123057 RepID=U5C1X2_9BACT|nr:hypothetical protein P872_01985 [Rhodonellum psychrophilum GCM71 = DSM 17998]
MDRESVQSLKMEFLEIKNAYPQTKRIFRIF